MNGEERHGSNQVATPGLSNARRANRLVLMLAALLVVVAAVTFGVTALL